MHPGTKEWVSLLNKHKVSCIVEYDVDDCFLNSPRGKVPPAFHHRVSVCMEGSSGLSFAISKDSRRLDRFGPSYSLHWDLSVSVLGTFS